MWARKKIISLKVYFFIKADDVKFTHDELKKTAVYVCFHMVFDRLPYDSEKLKFSFSRCNVWWQQRAPSISRMIVMLKVIFSIIVKLVMKLEKLTLRLGLNACLLDYLWRYLQVGFHTGFNFFWLTIYFSAVINSSNIIHRGVWFYSYSFWD